MGQRDLCLREQPSRLASRARRRAATSIWALALAFVVAAASIGFGAGAMRVDRARPPAYDLERPDASSHLADALREVSGLTILPDGRLGAVQDEDGMLYILEPGTGAVRGWVRFGRKGDYEGVETAGESIFVLRSDGTLFELAGWGDSEVRVRGYETGLDEDNDPEGLAFDVERDRLLIACKEEAGAGLGKKHRAVYAFDLTTRALVDEPVMSIALDDVAALLEDDDVDFKPSALAVNPIGGDVYVVSSNPPALAVIDPNGRLKHASRLAGKLFPQPEGIAFEGDGTLYISSEGADGPGVLHRYAPK